MPHFEYKNVNGLGFIQIHNVLELQQIDKVWEAYTFLKDSLLNPEHTSSAVYEDGAFKKRNKGIFLDDVRPIPPLYNEIKEVIHRGVASVADQTAVDSVYNSTASITWESILMQYYINDGDGYDAHFDCSLFTTLLFFNQEPKNFTGGDVTFPRYNVTVPFKNNCGIIFPGATQHQVNPITQINKSSDIGGRLSLAMFTGISD